MPPETTGDCKHSYREMIRQCERTLNHGYQPERARLDAETLLLYALQKAHPERNRAWLIAHMDDAMDRAVFRDFVSFAGERRRGLPVQYITGQAEFYGLPLIAELEVLIPRPETEHLVEEALRLAAQMAGTAADPITIADVGTGTGAIAIAIAHTMAGARLVATDISKQALDLARRNAEKNHVAERIEFVEGDLLAPLAGRRFSIIASNPPYIPLADKPTLPVEVREHEPHTALFAGDDGLLIHRRLVPDARELLVAGGWLLMEIGYGHQPAVQMLLAEAGYDEIHFIPDYQGIARVACGRWR